MLTILLRTIIIYISLLIIMRLMGKRQIGELEISDLVTTFLLSEIASLPITDTNIPLSFALIPMVVLLTFEVVSSWLLSRYPALKKLLAAVPATLIIDGQIQRREMLRSRISIDELIGELRQNGITDVSEVKYAILEQNGKITVIQKSEYKPITPDTLNLAVKESGIEHIVINDGKVNKHSLTLLGMKTKDIDDILNSRRLKKKEIYLMLIDDTKKVKIFKKESR